MTKLTTHVLDTANGVPAANMALRLTRLDGDSRELLVETETNSDGRCDNPLLEGADMRAGSYELAFEAGKYFKSGTDNPFVDCVVLRFGISDSSSHYHVPLLVSPYSYSTYRGS